MPVSSVPEQAHEQCAEALRESDERFRQVFDEAPIGMALSGKDHRFVRANASFCAMLGYTEDELQRLTFRDITHPDDVSESADHMRRIASGELTKYSAEKRYVRKDKSVMWGSLTVSVFHDSRGGFLYHYAIVVDISERKKAEASFRTATEELNHFFNVALDMFCITDTDGRFLRLNHEWERTLGYSLDELTAKSFYDFVHPDDLAATRETVALASQKKVVNFINRYRHKNGTYRWLEWRSLPSGRSIYAAVRDITERREAEESLRKSEERLRFALEGANDSLWDINVKTNEYYLSPRGCEMLGYAPDEIHVAAKTWPELVNPEDIPVTMQRLTDYLEGRTPMVEVEQRLRTKSGGWKWVLSRGKVAARDRDNNPLRLVGTHTDITERRQKEQELRESETRYRTLFENMLNGFSFHRMVVDKDNRPVDYVFLEVNEAFLRQTGLKRENVLTRRITEVNPAIKDDEFNWIAEYGKVALEGQTLHFEQYSGAFGRWYAVQAYAPFPGYFATIFEDITGRKEAEKALKESYERLRHSFNDTVTAITKIVETRDPYTAGHQRRVSQLGFAIARELGFPEKQAQGVRIAGLLHDVGKISVPTEILSKPGRLNPIEFDVIKIHPTAGYDILRTIEFPWPVAEVAYQHQERVDGSGYPRGLRGADILSETKVISVADTVEAMTFRRPYRAVVGLGMALEQIEKGKGRLYDREAADACLRLFKSGRFNFQD